jgi:murein DD-endopeptidase MepM/ murein hydrolase activator NlpD
MLKIKVNISILLLVVASGCTQPPAQIVMKGQQNFTRGNESNYKQSGNNQSSYNKSSYSSSSSSSGSSHGSNYDSSSSYENAPISENTVQNVSVDSIGVADLAPPSSSEKILPVDKVLPVNKVLPVELEPLSEPTPQTGYQRNKTIKTLNPWTNKPRSANEPEDKTEAIKSEAKLAPKLVNIYASKEKDEAGKIKIEAEAKHKEYEIIAAKSRGGDELRWPVSGRRILSSFGAKGGGKVNDGINIAAEKGEPVWAAADGEVVYVSNDLKDYGNMVLVKHADRKTTSYAHLNDTIVRKYQKIKRGDVIGYAGSTGNVKTSQLFFSLYNGKEAINPRKYMSSELAGL